MKKISILLIAILLFQTLPFSAFASNEEISVQETDLVESNEINSEEQEQVKEVSQRFKGGLPSGGLVTSEPIPAHEAVGIFSDKELFESSDISQVFHTSVFTFREIVIFSYFDDTEFVILNQKGEEVKRSTLGKDEYHVEIVEQGIYTIYSNKSFTTLIGDAISGSVQGFYAVDQSGKGLSTLLNTYMMKRGIGGEKFIVFGYEDGTEFSIRNLNTGNLLYAGTLNEGENFTLPSTPYSTFLQVAANKPVSALSYGDQDYYVPSANGRFSGTKFHGYSAYIGNWTNSITVTAYKDNTDVVIKNSNTGEIIKEMKLNAGQVYSHPVKKALYWTVESSKTVTAANIPFSGYSGNYYYMTRAVDESGVGNGKLFYVPTVSSRMDVFSYEDDNHVVITRLGQPGDYPYPSQTIIFDGVLNQSEGYTFNTSYGQYVYKVESDKNTSVLQSYSGAGAEFMPLSYALELPDLTVDTGSIKFSPDPLKAKPGDIVTAEVKIRNIGNVEAENVRVHAYDGDYGSGGITPLIGIKEVPIIDSQESVTVSFSFVLPENPEHRSFSVKIDPYERIKEANASNNLAVKTLLPNKDLLPPLSVSVAAPAGLELSQSNELTPNPFKVRATIFNTGTVAATDIMVDLSLEDGLELANGKKIITVNEIAPHSSIEVEWDLKADPAFSGPNQYSILVSASNAEPKDINRSINIPDFNSPSSPANLDVTPLSNGDLKLKWKSNEENDLSGYIIYYGEKSRGQTDDVSAYDGAAAAQGKSPIYHTKVNEFTLTGLEKGKTYFVAVAAYDTSMNISKPSNEVSESTLGAANYKQYTIGNLVLKGNFESTDGLTLDGKASINDFLMFKGKMNVDVFNATISGDGTFYIPVDNKLYYTNEIILYNGTFSIDAKKAKIDMLSGVSKLMYDKIPIEISDIQILSDGLSMSGNFTFNKILKTEDRNSTLNIDELSLTTSKGLQFKGKWNLPDFNKGLLEINKPYIEIDTKEEIVGGGGTVGKMGKLIKPKGPAEITANFQIVKGKLNEIGIEGKMAKPIPIAQSGFGVSALGGGLENIQKLNSDNGVTIYAKTDIADMFSPVIKDNRLIQANDLTLKLSSMHANGSGQLNLYAYKLANSMTDFHVKKGFNSDGRIDIASILIGEANLKKPNKHPFSGYGLTSIRVPKDVWFIGGIEFTRTRVDINEKEIKGSVRFLGQDVGVKFDFETGKLSAASQDGPYLYIQEEDDVAVLYGTNMRSTGTYHSEDNFSALSQQEEGVIVTLNGQESALLEISAEDISDQYTVIKPDGTEYELVFSGEDANALLDEEKNLLYVSIVEAIDGDWKIISEEPTVFTVQLISVKNDPVIHSVSAEPLSLNNAKVTWDAHPAEDVTVSIYASEEKGENTGYLLAEQLPAKGETVVTLPEQLDTGDYYIYVKAEREGNGSDWMYADKTVAYVDELSPDAPTVLGASNISNGSFTVSWTDDKNTDLDGYLIANLVEGKIDYENSVYVEKDKKEARINHWQQNQSYELVVLAVSTSGNEEEELIHYSPQSNVASFYLPASTPPTMDLQFQSVDGDIHEKDFEGDTYYFTNKEQVQVQGKTDENVLMSIILNGEPLYSAEASELNETITLGIGLNEMQVSFVDQNGDETVKTYQFYFDSISPVLHVDAPKDGITVNGSTILINGQTEAGSILTVNGENVNVGENGDFQHEIVVPSDKNTENITITAADFAGNQENYSAVVTVEHNETEPSYFAFERKTDVDPAKRWNVKFNRVIDEASVTNTGVYIEDENGEVVIGTNAILAEDGKTILIEPPAEGYHSRKTYTLYIESSIISKSGKKLKQPVKMDFTIK